MKTATGLALIALGAILAFALTEQPSFLNLHVVGWVLMLTGAVGIAVPRAKHGRLRRRTVWRGERPTQEVEVVETDAESKFSALIAPGGIELPGDSTLERGRPAVSMAPEGTRRQPGNGD